MSDEPKRLTPEVIESIRALYWNPADFTIRTGARLDVCNLLDHIDAIEVELAAAKQRAEKGWPELVADGNRWKERAENLQIEIAQRSGVALKQQLVISVLQNKETKMTAELAQAKESLASIEAELAATKEARGG